MTMRPDDAAGHAFDTVIVGGGSAGCVMAARLSEDADRSVLLIESGRDITAADCPPEALSPYPGYAYFDPSLTYADLKVRYSEGVRNAPTQRPAAPYSQGRALGGGSLVNGLGANRGAPADYEEWVAAGAEGWGWDDVLPYFRRLERDLECGGELHGTEGPLPIRRIPEDWRSGFVRAGVTQLAAEGIGEKPDQNGPWEDGVFAQKVALDESFRRVSTSLGWLTPEVRRRPNLTILTGAQVRRIGFEDGRAAGVFAAIGDRETFIGARETILCAGALQSPALLMRSGVGPGPHLQERGIAVLRHRPGVGRNLMEHPYAGLAFHLPRGARTAAEHHHIPVIWRFSSGLDGCAPGDMHMGLMGRSAWHAVGRRLGALAFWVNKSFSRGEVRLAADPAAHPDVAMRLLSDERDLVRLRDAFRRAAALGAAIAASGAAGPPQPARMSDRARRYGAHTWRNRLLTGLAGVAIDIAGPYGAALTRTLTYQGPSVADLLANEAELDTYLMESVVGVWHASGTCRMGAHDDPMAVTDAEGRVRGVTNLRVCDASIFPTIPCANINVPVIMTAEKIAAAVRGRSPGGAG